MDTPCLAPQVVNDLLGDPAERPVLLVHQGQRRPWLRRMPRWPALGALLGAILPTFMTAAS
jgi:hypothetical protein